MLFDRVFNELASDPHQGDEVEGRAGLYVFTARYRKRKAAHKHRIFYRITPEGIEIFRVLHTAMQWPDHL